MSSRFATKIDAEFEEVETGVYDFRAKGLFDDPKGRDYFKNSGRLEYLRKKAKEKLARQQALVQDEDV